MAPRKKKKAPKIVQRSRQAFYGIQDGRIAIVTWLDTIEKQVVSTANTDGTSARMSTHPKLVDALKEAKLWLLKGDESC